MTWPWRVIPGHSLSVQRNFVGSIIWEGPCRPYGWTRACGYSYPRRRKIPIRSLGKDQCGVRANVKRAAVGEAVVVAGLGDHVTGPMAFESVTVPLPVAVEAKPPGSCGREADDVVTLGLVEKVGNNHDVVPWSTLVPPVVGEE